MGAMETVLVFDHVKGEVREVGGQVSDQDAAVRQAEEAITTASGTPPTKPR